MYPGYTGACLTMLAVVERTDHHRSMTQLAVRSQQKLAIVRRLVHPENNPDYIDGISEAGGD